MRPEPTAFLYPFIEADERDAPALVADLSSSARAKIADSTVLRSVTIERSRHLLESAGTEMAQRFRRGGRLFAFGNGGSSTDVEGTVDLYRNPPRGPGLPAMSLVEDPAVLTALANDVGFDLVFSRQIIAHAGADDVALGFSTSGDYRNVLRALEEASVRHLLTIGLCGYQGGAMATSAAVDYCFVVRSESVHRIQEAQNALTLRLWEMVQQDLDAVMTA
jgi:D-sedoheptulose 7-phosphate isomerase